MQWPSGLRLTFFALRGQQTSEGNSNTKAWASGGGMISFIIPAYNEELLLGRTLRALDDAARGLGEPFEIIVVDDASTDRTADVAREHGARVVSVNRRQIAATRNAGAREASGELLFFIDADTVVTAAAV